MKKRFFRCTEPIWADWFMIGVSTLMAVLMYFEGERGLMVSTMCIAVYFLYFGWPRSIEIMENGDLIFRGMLRVVRITPASLVSVRAGKMYRRYAYAYVSHVTLRTKWGYPVGYRYLDYENADDLAQSVLDFIARAPNVTVDPQARNWLRQMIRRHLKKGLLKQQKKQERGKLLTG